MNHVEIGEKLRKARKEKKISQEKLAEKAGLSVSTIKRLESGLSSSYKIENIESVANALGIQIYSLLEENEFQNLLRAALEEEFQSTEELEKEVDWHVQIQTLFFPNTEYLSEYPIRTLLEFLVYLPLMNWFRLIDFLVHRINGDMSSNGCYVCRFLKILYDEIPNDEAKYFADVISEKLQYKFQYNQYSDSTEASRFIEEYCKRVDSVKWDTGYKKYQDRLEYLSKMSQTFQTLLSIGQ